MYYILSESLGRHLDIGYYLEKRILVLDILISNYKKLNKRELERGHEGFLGGAVV